MPKVLLVEPDERNRAKLAKVLEEVGYDVAAAPNGSSAVGALEWERPDLVVSPAKVEDMDGYELYMLVRKDPTTMDTPFLLLAGRDRPLALAATEAGVTMILTGDLTSDRIVECVGALVLPAGRDAVRARASVVADEAPDKRRPEPLWAVLGALGSRSSTTSAGAELQGSLEAMDLGEVAQAIALGGKTGSLVVSLGDGDGTIVFRNGRAIHATLGERTGEDAFAAIVAASHRERSAHFSFARMERTEASAAPRTISRSVEQLLLSIAVGIDEGDAGGERLEDASTRRAEG